MKKQKAREIISSEIHTYKSMQHLEDKLNKAVKVLSNEINFGYRRYAFLKVNKEFTKLIPVLFYFVRDNFGGSVYLTQALCPYDYLVSGDVKEVIAELKEVKANGIDLPDKVLVYNCNSDYFHSISTTSEYFPALSVTYSISTAIAKANYEINKPVNYRLKAKLEYNKVIDYSKIEYKTDYNFDTDEVFYPNEYDVLCSLVKDLINNDRDFNRDLAIFDYVYNSTNIVHVEHYYGLGFTFSNINVNAKSLKNYILAHTELEVEVLL